MSVYGTEKAGAGRVFVVQEAYGRDYMPAGKFGELIAMLPSDMQIYLSATTATRKLNRFLKDYNDNDYLLLSGDPVLIGLAVGIATGNNRGRAKLLKWDKRAGQYHPVEVDLFQKGESNEP